MESEQKNSLEPGRPRCSGKSQPKQETLYKTSCPGGLNDQLGWVGASPELERTSLMKVVPSHCSAILVGVGGATTNTAKGS